MASGLPSPTLRARRLGARGVSVLTDDALSAAIGVRIAFTGREGGVSEGAYASLNLGAHVGDDPERVSANRRALMEALGAERMELVVPSQVHGTHVAFVRSADAGAVGLARDECAAGADAVAVGVGGVAALLCFADCVPLVVVSPSGRFAVAHAGWRGAIAGVASAAVRAVLSLDAELGGADVAAAGRDSAADGLNVYVGPHIHAECFQVGSEVRDAFQARFGACCVADATHVDLSAAVRRDLVDAGVAPSRIADAGVCTACERQSYFSYRASGGACGRHAALAFKEA